MDTLWGAQEWGQMRTRLRTRFLGQAGTLVSASHVLPLLLWLPDSLACLRWLFFLQHCLPRTTKKVLQRNHYKTPSSQIFAPLGMFPALWFYQLSCCLVCIDEKVGNMPKHPIALGLIFALSTVSGADFHSICMWMLLDIYKDVYVVCLAKWRGHGRSWLWKCSYSHCWFLLSSVRVCTQHGETYGNKSIVVQKV